MMKKYLKLSIVSLIIMLFLSSFLAMAQENKSGRLIKFETSQGDMLVMLYDETPLHRDNMIKLIKDGF